MADILFNAPPDGVLDFRRGQRPPLSLPGIGGVVLAHAALLGALISFELIPAPLEIQPLIVQLLPAAPRAVPAPPAPAQKTPPPKAPRRAPVSAPTLAAQAATPAAAEVAERTVAEPAPATRTAAAEAPASSPRFDADYLDNPSPVYPALARRLREEGKVFLRVFVEADGRPGRIEIKTSSGSPRLDQAAEQAVWRWKFIPAKRGNEAISAWVVVPISFNLKV